jgi:hypothetical protein
VLDKTSVYYGGEGFLERINKDGTGLQRLISDLSQLPYIAQGVDDAAAYFTTFSSSGSFQVGKVGKDGAGQTQLKLLTGSGGDFASNTASLFVAESGNVSPGSDAVFKIAKDATSSSSLVNASASALRADDTYLFYSVPPLDAGVGGVVRVHVDGTAPLQIATETADVIVLDATNLYWVREELPRSIRRAAKDGSGLGTVCESPGSDLAMLAADKDSLYFVSGNAIFKVAKAGSSPPASLFKEPPSSVIQAIAVDECFVFWTTSDHKLRKLAK